MSIEHEEDADLFAELYGKEEDDAEGGGEVGAADQMAVKMENTEESSSSSEEMPEVVLQADVVEQNLEASKAAGGGMRMTGTQHRVLVRDESKPAVAGAQSIAVSAAAAPEAASALDHPLAPITMAKLKHDAASSVFDYNFEDLEGDKPWLAPGANISDFFNYGFDEDTWREYVKKQQDFRGSHSKNARISVVGADASSRHASSEHSRHHQEQRRSRSRSPPRYKRKISTGSNRRRDRSPGGRSSRRSPDVKRRR